MADVNATSDEAARIDLVQRSLADGIRAHEAAQAQSAAIARAAAICAAALAAEGKVLVCGNGGSAAEAQHFAAELLGRFLQERRALPSIALTTDTSALTAIANDYGFERVFERQVEALGRAGDVLLGISTSGRSINVVRAFQTARARGLSTIALTGPHGRDMGAAADVLIAIPAEVTPRIQEVQLTILHIICELIEHAAVARDR